MNLIITGELKLLEECDFEIVERKGRGHPDTLSDRLAELLSQTYSEFTLHKFGAILRHQFDKLSLMGGKCDVRFGGGEFRSPIRLLINGRATSRFGKETFAVKELLVRTAATFLEQELRSFKFTENCILMWEVASNPTRGMIDETNQGSSPIHYRFQPRSLDDLPEATKPISDDTAVGCAWAPFTPVESMVLEIERSLTSNEALEKYPWLGTDCKIMAYRSKMEVNLTVSIPMVSSHIRSAEQYVEYCNQTLSLIRLITDRYGFSEVAITLNPGDNTDNEMLYMRLTGSCIESGDEGQVSRGNRIGGIISSRRPFSIEGLSGKNPSYHAGKLYSAAAWEIAKRLWNEQGVPSEVFIVSQIDRPIDDPWAVVINSNGAIDRVEAERVAQEVIVNMRHITKGFLERKYPLAW